MADTMTQGRSKRKPTVPMWAYGVGAGVIAVGYFLYSRSKAKNAAAAAAASGTTMSSTNAPTPGVDYQGSSAADLATALADLSGSQATTTGTTAAQFTPPTNLVSQGSGLGLTPGSSGTETAASGTTYSYIPSAKALQSLIASGQQVFYQPSAGVFMPYNPKTTAPNTPTYVKVT